VRTPFRGARLLSPPFLHTSLHTPGHLIRYQMLAAMPRRSWFFSCSALALVISAACLRWRTGVYAMTWAYADRGPCPEGTRNIVLSFVRYRHYYYGICSRDLGPYLESLHSSTLSVEFAVLDVAVRGAPRTFGGGKPTRIGDKTKWDSPFEYAGEQGSSADISSPALDSNPWEVLRQHR
jgi:hypothetical protein